MDYLFVFILILQIFQKVKANFQSLYNLHYNNLIPIAFTVEVDILKMVNVSAKDQGVSLVEGPINKFPAYKFRLAYNSIPLHNSDWITKAINNTNGFTIVFVMRQQKNNLGALLSINSPGRLTPWLQVSSNSKTGLLSLKYKALESKKLRQIEWNLPKHHRKSLMAGNILFFFLYF